MNTIPAATFLTDNGGFFGDIPSLLWISGIAGAVFFAFVIYVVSRREQ